MPEAWYSSFSILLGGPRSSGSSYNWESCEEGQYSIHHEEFCNADRPFSITRTLLRFSSGGLFRKGMSVHVLLDTLRLTAVDRFIPLMRSSNFKRIKSNVDIFDFELDKTDMTDLDSLDKGAEGAVSWNPIFVD